MLYSTVIYKTISHYMKHFNNVCTRIKRTVFRKFLNLIN